MNAAAVDAVVVADGGVVVGGADVADADDVGEYDHFDGIVFPEIDFVGDKTFVELNRLECRNQELIYASIYLF